MKKTIIGVIVTTLVLFVWGFLFWGQVLHSVPYESGSKAVMMSKHSKCLNRLSLKQEPTMYPASLIYRRIVST
jgi:hypothetical protein